MADRSGLAADRSAISPVARRPAFAARASVCVRRATRGFAAFAVSVAALAALAAFGSTAGSELEARREP
jgi:hypothetical protein